MVTSVSEESAASIFRLLGVTSLKTINFIVIAMLILVPSLIEEKKDKSDNM
jgi:hypothetical protein